MSDESEIVRLASTDPLSLFSVPENYDEETLRIAYATLIKRYRPDTSRAEFMAIRDAFERLRALLEKTTARVVESIAVTQPRTGADKSAFDERLDDLERRLLEVHRTADFPTFAAAYENLLASVPPDRERSILIVRVLSRVLWAAEGTWIARVYSEANLDQQAFDQELDDRMTFFELLLGYQEVRRDFLLGHPLRTVVDDAIRACPDFQCEANIEVLRTCFQRLLENRQALFAAFPVGHGGFRILPILKALLWNANERAARKSVAPEFLLEKLSSTLEHLSTATAQYRRMHGNTMTGAEFYAGVQRQILFHRFSETGCSLAELAEGLAHLSGERYGRTLDLIRYIDDDYAFDFLDLARAHFPDLIS